MTRLNRLFGYLDKIRKRTLAYLVLCPLGLSCFIPVAALSAGNATSAASTSHPTPQITVLTLNIAHGRSSNGLPQFMQRSKSIRSNLDQIAKLLTRVSPDVVAIQEADAASKWSGRFNHVEYLAEKADFTFFAHGRHVKAKRGEYGTALLSKHPLQETKSVTFAPSRPTPNKGFVVTQVKLPSMEKSGQPFVTFVSLHLDFARQSIRQRQIRNLIEHIKSVNGPLIIMGDFNCDGARRKDVLTTLKSELNLQAYKPKAKNLTTFPSNGKRLDWILISGDLKFDHYEVLPDQVSDHLAILAKVTFNPAVQKSLSPAK